MCQLDTNDESTYDERGPVEHLSRGAVSIR